MADTDIYSVSSGRSILGGRTRPPNRLGKVTLKSSDGSGPRGTETIPVLYLHGSGGQNFTTCDQYLAETDWRQYYEDQKTFSFSLARTTRTDVFNIRPNDLYGTYANSAKKESMWLGFFHAPTNKIAFITERRLEALLAWSKDNLSFPDWNYLCCIGGSMGGWGTLTFGTHRYSTFAALYPDRPRWRYNSTIGKVAVADWTGVLDSYTVGTAPSIHAEDGSGSVAVYHDITTFVSNTQNKIPWIGWNVGRQDPFVNFSDHVDAVAAMRTAKRGFAFAWNDGDHTGGSIPGQITQSYPYGTFKLGRGYPLFTNHSLDNDPSVDLAGGINIGLSFRNVVESSTSWSCEVTNILNPCTVTVEPISETFTASVTPQNLTIPAANAWVPVSFAA